MSPPTDIVFGAIIMFVVCGTGCVMCLRLAIKMRSRPGAHHIQQRKGLLAMGIICGVSAILLPLDLVFVMSKDSPWSLGHPGWLVLLGTVILLLLIAGICAGGWLVGRGILGEAKERQAMGELTRDQ